MNKEIPLAYAGGIFQYAFFDKVDGDEVRIIRVLYARRNFMQILFGKAYDEP